MSDFSILPQAGQNRLFRTQDRSALTTRTALHTAETLTGQLASKTGPLSEKEQKAAQDLLEDFKDSVEFTSNLSRSLASNKDAMRKERIARMEARIEQLKELLRFATPEQAKRLLKELKQVAKEFSGAANGLKKAATETGGASSLALTATANAAGSALETSLNGPPQTVVPLAGDPTGSSSTSEGAGQASYPAASAARLAAAQISATAGADETDPGNDGGPSTAPGRTEQTKAYQSAVYAYADQQLQAEDTHDRARIAGMRDDHEKLRKIAKDIEMLTNRLEALAEKDDDETEKDLKDIRKALKAGINDLNSPELKEALNQSGQDLSSNSSTGDPSPVIGPVSGTASGTSINLSISITNIVV